MVLYPVGICTDRVNSGTGQLDRGGGHAVWGFFNPFFVQAWTCYKCVKQGTFDNPRSGLLLKLFCFIKVVSYIFLIPLLLQLLFVKWGFGTGWRGLTKKGKIGNHPG